MTGIDSFAAKEAAVSSDTETSLPPGADQGDSAGLAGHTRPSRMLNLLAGTPKRRLLRSRPSARDGVWVNTAQPPDDPETSWPSTVFNPFASDSAEMVVPTGPPTEDLVQVPETARRRRGRHAAPRAGIGSLLARKLAANR
jgi:hypothetical protein